MILMLFTDLYNDVPSPATHPAAQKCILYVQIPPGLDAPSPGSIRLITLLTRT